MLTRVRIWFGLLLVSSGAACAGRPLELTPRPRLAAVAAGAGAGAGTGTGTDADSGAGAGAGAGTGTGRIEPCAEGMVHVRFDYCPDVRRRCLDKEYDKPNHITICKRFAAEKPECLAPRIALDFCIDEYEYPNQVGKKPAVMLNFFEASGLCAAEHKRLCYESEWVTACEGPDERPFPYGYERSSQQCNFDNRWVDPHLGLVYAKDPNLQQAELARLDRSVQSGQMPGCVSDFGVHDLTGNVDEWVRADHDRPRERAKFAALKGGAWGHVRNACRPVTTSHVPEFRYYFIGFRCCSEAVH